MSGLAGRAAAVSLAAGLILGVVKQPANAQDIVPIWPTMDRPASAVPAPAPAPAPTAPAAPPQPVAAAAPATPPAPTKPVAVAVPSSSQPTAIQPADARFDQLVAPVALYPDPLLGQVLMASTYPQEIVEAARWVRIPANRALSGDALTKALRAKGWNPSVMALVPFPGLLTAMADKLDWTGQLGSAFLAQQGDMVAAVQRLRHAALAAGSLRAMPECHCVIQTSGDIISIRPSNAEFVAVPIYNPEVAFGAWTDAAHPPAAFPLPPGFAVLGKAVGFRPAVEVGLSGPIWGWASIDWANRRIAVDNRQYAMLIPGHAAFAGGVWAHEAPPSHIAYAASAAVVRPGHRASAKAVKHFVRMHSPSPPPPPWWDSPYQAWGPPPGTIVPPPPRHTARNWYDSYYFDQYR